MSRICSYKFYFEKHLVGMKYGSRQDGTQVTLFKNQKEMNKVKFPTEWDKNKTKKNSTGVPLVITVHPLLKDFGNII